MSKSASDIVWVSVRDAASNLTTLRFSNMRKGVGVNDSLFQVKIPNGADVVELGPMNFGKTKIQYRQLRLRP